MIDDSNVYGNVPQTMFCGTLMFNMLMFKKSIPHTL